MNRGNRNGLLFLCCLVYFSSYMTRNNYATALTEIIEDLHISKQTGSLAVTGSFITYGIGQLISGVLGDRISPRLVVGAGLAATSVVNVSVACMPSVGGMTVLWVLNGLFQAMLWPPLVRMMADHMTHPQYERGMFVISVASASANVLLYLYIPAVIALSGWRLAFVICGVWGLIATALWMRGTARLTPTQKLRPEIERPTKAAVPLRSVAIQSGLWAILLAVLVQGTLRDGITTWMPTYIYEVFGLGTTASILTSVILPLFTVLSIYAATALQRRVGDVLKTAGLLFGLALGLCVLLAAVYARSMALEAVLMSLVNACMHGVNLMLICQLPRYYANTGKISTVSGVLNAAVYAGSALSAYGFAALVSTAGWRWAVVLWVGLCAVGTVLCITNLKRWQSYVKQCVREREE